MRTIRLYFQHFFNPLHIYCRLRQFGIENTTAQRVCTVYERFIYRAFKS